MEREELAGRELDCEVARVLFGWTGVHQDTRGEWVGSPAEGAPACYRVDDYSTRAEDAKAVREEMDRRRWWWKLTGGAPFMCWFYPIQTPYSEDDAPHGTGATEEEAVCRGALCALAAESGEPGAQE